MFLQRGQASALSRCASGAAAQAIMCMWPGHGCVVPSHQTILNSFSSPSQLYIGRSNDITRRFGEHMKAAYNYRLHGKETERVHAHMAHNHTSGWFMVPIFRCANYESDAIVCERRFIRSFNKNRLLNSEPISLKHPHLKHNSLKRNPKHKPHSKKRVRSRHAKHLEGFTGHHLTFQSTQGAASLPVLAC